MKISSCINNLTTQVIGVLLLVFILGSCATPEKLSRSGQYDEAIQLAVHKLRKKKQKDKHVLALEQAFKKANHRDILRIRFLKKEGEPSSWTQINNIYKNIRRRQTLVKQVIPLHVQSEGDRLAIFRFEKTDEGLIESKEKAANYLYESAKVLMLKAEKGDRLAARKAFTKLNATKKYFRNEYKDRRDLLRRAKTLGTNRVYFKIKNSSGSFLPPNFEKEIKSFSIDNLRSEWVSYYLSPNNKVNFDYTIIANITRIDVSPELITDKQYIDEKEIEDGFDYALDPNGNVMKDTSGNDIKIPRTKTISVSIFETKQHKAATISGKIDFYRKTSSALLKSVPISTEMVFDNYAARYRGDKRALSKESKSKLGNEPLPFPSDVQMLMDAADRLKPSMKNIINDNLHIVEH